MNCPKCQAPVSADWVVCPKCGASLNQPPSGIPLTEVKQPSRWQYLAATAIIIVTSALALGLLISSLFGILIPDLRVVVPGTHSIDFDKTGYYVLFCENESILDGKIYSGGSISDMTLNLYRDDSSPVELAYTSSTIPYEMESRSGYSVFDFNVDEAGTYTLVAEYNEGKSGPDTVVAIGRMNIIEAFIVPFIIGTLGLIIGFIIIFRAILIRRRISLTAGVTPVDKFWC